MVDIDTLLGPNDLILLAFSKENARQLINKPGCYWDIFEHMDAFARGDELVETRIGTYKKTLDGDSITTAGYNQPSVTTPCISRVYERVAQVPARINYRFFEC